MGLPVAAGRPDRSSNLPAPPTPLIGREADRSHARSLLLAVEGRLLTLTGTGGVGKTRLALAVAEAVAADFPDGTFFADLAPLADPALVLPAIAAVLGLRGVPDERLAETLEAALRDRRPLVLLDNCEHLLPGLASPVDALLAACPGLVVLATSREPLRLRREQLFPVAPLALPDPAASPSLDELAQTPAVALFVARARAADPAFVLDGGNEQEVVRLVGRLDGLPLAIELAAARVRMLPPQAMLAHLDHRLALLRWEAQDLPPRQRTLRAAIGWSYALLEPAEQALFRRLGVFAGGCPPAAIGSVGDVAGAESAVLDRLAALVDKNLVRVLASGENGPRCGLLETVREFALDRLAASGELAATQARHRAYFLALAEQARPELTGPRSVAWLDRLDREHDNLRAALASALEKGTDGEAALRLAGALWRFWYGRGHLDEGRRWLERVLDGNPAAPAALRGTALSGAGFLALWQGDYERATALCEESLALARSVGDRSGEAWALICLASAARFTGRLDRADALLAESLALSRALGNSWETALVLRNQGSVARLRGDRERAEALMEEALSRFRGTGDRREVATSLALLAEVVAEQGAVERAIPLLAEGLTVCRTLGNRGTLAFGADIALRVMAGWAAPEPVARLLGAAEALRGATDLARTPTERANHDRVTAAVRRRLGEAAFEAAWTDGSALAPGQIVEQALAVLEPVRPAAAPATGGIDDRPSPLSGREREVLALVAEGMTSKQIGVRLFVAERTVNFHVGTVLAKLGVATRAQAAAEAIRRGLL